MLLEPAEKEFLHELLESAKKALNEGEGVYTQSIEYVCEVECLIGLNKSFKSKDHEQYFITFVRADEDDERSAVIREINLIVDKGEDLSEVIAGAIYHSGAFKEELNDFNRKLEDYFMPDGLRVSSEVTGYFLGSDDEKDDRVNIMTVEMQLFVYDKEFGEFAKAEKVSMADFLQNNKK